MAENPQPGPGESRPAGEFVRHKLYHVRIVRLGFVHLVIGVLAICIGVFDVTFSSVALDIFTQSKIGTGVWTGTVIAVTGSIGLVTSRSELRRRTTILLFGGFSALSMLMAAIMLGVGISEISTVSFVQGAMDGNCFTSSNTTVEPPTATAATTVRCLATATINQKLTTASIIIILGFFDSLVGLLSITTTRDIFLHKYAAENGTENFNLGSMSVSEYFDRRYQEQPNTVFANQGTNPNPELPDSDQFRSHLEGVENDYSNISN